MLLEIAFAMTPRERRIVVIYVRIFSWIGSLICMVLLLCVQKYIDAFASALGFFLIGFDGISGYKSPQHIGFKFFDVSDPVLWFFKVLLCTSCVL